MAGGNWLNDDGLYIKYGRSEGISQDNGGVVAGSFAGEQVATVGLDLTALTATETILNDVVTLPKDAMITKVVVHVVEAATGGTSVEMGMIAADRSTEIDYDGLLASVLLADINVVGETNTYTEAGLIGTILAAKGYLSASATGTFTAGKLRVDVHFDPKAATL